MFGFGMSEIILIMAVALIVVGPKKLPEVAKGLGKGYAEFKKYMTDFKDAVNLDIDTEPAKKPAPKKAQEVYDEHYKDATTVDAEPADAKTETAEQQEKTAEAPKEKAEGKDNVQG
ncbi:sec-independent translocation protein mttA/Hcf106 [Denitrovibrio acetiphilus DSM 12809]|uniref:Sec-independent protein translocase protein TatA n=1 Tax=Denitrovibrio acetiphilus (strain DSM 12809 / NBRC 114555 / N2460) TaxID=522772 RepID=D4H3V3_DENA2|nr:twin-arginine translocase TatA/TatE family subunit [Denitrovibrio acetiphilus]ADD69205.1 sec-independent translocation protein mttA/Hcf106 [Denitrovibrio acetiphilus DSM 12809]